MQDPDAGVSYFAPDFDVRDLAPDSPVGDVAVAAANVVDSLAQVRRAAHGPAAPPPDLAHALTLLERDTGLLLAKAVLAADDGGESGFVPNIATAATASGHRVFMAACTVSAALRLAAARDRDAAALLLHEASLERESVELDPLTRAYERAHGLAALQREVVRSRRGDGRLVIGYVDVDSLKRTNDTYGHAAGDELLCAVVETVKTSMRPYDVVARLGGDEFVYSLAGTTVSAARHRADTMLAELRGSRVRGSASAGFAELRPGDTLEAVMARADADLYSRRAGRRL